MNWAPRHTRLLLIVLVLLGAGSAVGLTLLGLKQNVTYFFSPTDIAEKADMLLSENRVIRIGGMVEEGSIVKSGADGLDLHFTVTDYNQTLRVEYHGLPPDLFRAGQGVVAEGKLKEKGLFKAATLLAKHDENYMPPEVAKSLHKRPVGENQPTEKRQ